MTNFKKITLIVFLIVLCCAPLSSKSYCTDKAYMYNLSQPTRPVITHWTEDTYVFEGEPVRMSASVSCYPFPEAWIERDGMIIKPSKDYKINQTNGTITLEIASVSLSDEGIYSFCFKNSAGIVKKNCRLTVRQRPE